jgi:methylmalonyl-CoA mutase N-terminal domain/subunit
VDPVGGAYAIEEWTDRLEREASQILERIASAGGTLAAIEGGLMQRDIQESAYRAQRDFDAGKVIVVGVNRYTDAERGSGSVFRLDPSVEEAQIARVREVRASRSASLCQEGIDAVERAARGGDNLVPAVIDAVDRHATLGEIADALRRVFGEYHDATSA